MQDWQIYREVLLRDIASLDVAALDWRPAAESITIGTSLLHIAAVEYLVIGAIELQRGRAGPSSDRSLWPMLQPGFARELQQAACAGRPCSFYTDLLQQVRSAGETVMKADWQALSLQQALKNLLVRLGLDPGQQQRLQAPLGLPLSIADGTHREPIMMALIAHESYHRGQITQSNFLYRTAMQRGGG